MKGHCKLVRDPCADTQGGLHLPACIAGGGGQEEEQDSNGFNLTENLNP